MTEKAGSEGSFSLQTSSAQEINSSNVHANPSAT